LALDISRKVGLYSDQKVLMYASEARKEGAVNDYLLQEIVRIRMDELREEASRARTVQGARASRERRHYLGILGVSRTPERGGFSRGTVEEACCA
jgi:hypothetical protein